MDFFFKSLLSCLLLMCPTHVYACMNWGMDGAEHETEGPIVDPAAAACRRDRAAGEASRPRYQPVQATVQVCLARSVWFISLYTFSFYLCLVLVLATLTVLLSIFLRYYYYFKDYYYC